ncbi:MAG: Holliday junction branch migration protein RuvA, partial [Clostridia bacterium]|nr:Holliday junction branch migration protein RuvA [Clostridia bacterium]
MLAFINGILREKYEGVAVIECNGLGYELILTNSAFCNLPNEDEQVKLPTYLHIR